MELIQFLHRHQSNFAWATKDMTRIFETKITQKPNVDPSFALVKQKRRKCAADMNKAINDNVDRLLKAGKFPKSVILNG